MVVVLGFFVTLAIPIIAAAVGKMSEADASDLLKTIASITAGPVGAVVGFYYSSNRGNTPD